jgi:predicted phosphodiesterase
MRKRTRGVRIPIRKARAPQRPRFSVVLSDLHSPFHNKAVLPRICQFLHDAKPDHLVLAGDAGDYYSVSRHHAGSLGLLKDITLGYEYDEQNLVLDSLDAAVGHCDKEFIDGNHEDMVVRWLNTGDNAKVKGALGLPHEALRLKERGWSYQRNWKEARVDIGKCAVVHGEYCSQHCAKKHLDEYEHSVMFGHTHRIQSYVTGLRGAWGIGGLFDKNHPAFGYASASQRRRWANGFGCIYSFDDGSFLPHIVPIWNDRFVWGGKLY